MSWEAKRFAEGERIRAAELAAAEAKARESGKEPFDLARLEQALNRGSQKANAEQHRRQYYLLYPEARTLAEYAKMLIDSGTAPGD